MVSKKITASCCCLKALLPASFDATHPQQSGGHLYTNSWSVFLDLAPPPHRQGTVFVFISLGRLFSVEGPPRGRLAAPQHSSSLHQRPPRSAILGLSAARKRTAAQRLRGEGRDGRCRRLSQIVRKKWDKRENEWREGVCLGMRAHTHMHSACLHMFPRVSNMCFAHFAAMPTILRGSVPAGKQEEATEPFSEICWIYQ